MKAKLLLPSFDPLDDTATKCANCDNTGACGTREVTGRLDSAKCPECTDSGSCLCPYGRERQGLLDGEIDFEEEEELAT